MGSTFLAVLFIRKILGHSGNFHKATKRKNENILRTPTRKKNYPRNSLLCRCFLTTSVFLANWAVPLELFHTCFLTTSEVLANRAVPPELSRKAKQSRGRGVYFTLRGSPRTIPQSTAKQRAGSVYHPPRFPRKSPTKRSKREGKAKNCKA